MLASAFDVPEGSYREYLGAFSAWAPKPKGSLHTCRNSRECQCGKFSSVLKAKRPGLHQEGDHVPDPNLGLSFGDIDPQYRVPVSYTPNFPLAVPPPRTAQLPAQD